jgi:hypothetical protein
MYPTLHYELAKAHGADLHRQAERDRAARTARLIRKTHRRQFVAGDLATDFAQRVLAVLAARTLRPPVPPGQAPKTTT